MKRRIIALLLVLLLLVTAMPLGALAAQTSEETQSTKIEAESPAMLQSSEINYVYFDTIEEAGIYLREGLINRSFTRVSENTLEVHIACRKSKTSEDDADMMSIVFEHTGNPKGGDLLARNILFEVYINSEDDTYNYFTCRFFSNTPMHRMKNWMLLWRSCWQSWTWTGKASTKRSALSTTGCA